MSINTGYDLTVALGTSRSYPPDDMAEKFEDFDLLYSGKCNGVVPVYKYRSNVTGLTVVVAQVEGPLVNGYFCLATEAHDDDGLPHTLEHLVFMGSEKYPYKGVLDLLANRCLASGTNAWTDTDHTCYTMTTAGAEGFMNLLPIYLDHVLYPTLTESAYKTEVHHVNGEGEDAGVVYCEMQGCENTGENRTHLALVRAMYPGNCGYKSETGGMLENLRTSTSHLKVCNYHKEFYRPENLCVVITGQVNASQVFPVIKPFEEKIAAKGSMPPYKRPWQSAVPPLEASVEEVVPFPSDDEDHGTVKIAWRIAKAKEFYKMSAIMVLMEYLTDTAVAPLQRDFVEVPDPFCSKVSYSIIENADGCAYLSFENVPKEKLTCIKERVLELLKKLASGEEVVNMTRMGNVIQHQILDSLSNLEDHPHDTIAFDMIGDFLYGNTKEDIQVRLNRVTTFRKLKTEPQEFWVNLLKAYFVGTNYVVIIGEPSEKLMEQMGTAEKERVKKQQKALGEKGLTGNGEIVEKATKANEVEPPDEMITCVSVPDVKRIQFHHIQPSSNHEKSTANSNAKFPLAGIPVLFQLDDIQTNFVTLICLLDTGCLPQNLKSYLPLYLEVILESSIIRNKELISHKDIIAELAADTVHASTSVGVMGSRFNCGNFSEVACVELKVELEKYTKGVQWLQELLYAVQLSPDRLKVIATKMLKDVTRMKRKGSAAVGAVMKNMLFSRSSNLCISSMMRQQTFLGQLLTKLESSDPATAKKVLTDMAELQQLLTRPCNIRVHLAAPVQRLVQLGIAPNMVWEKDFLPVGVETGGERLTVKRAVDFINSDLTTPTGMVVGVGAVESSFLMQATPSVSSFDHEDIPAILVFVQYLTQLEGPMWRQIRGLGLAYHYSMFLKPESGLLYFVLYKSTHAASGYKVAKQIVDGYMDGSTPFSPIEMESCKSSLIFELIDKINTPAKASTESLLTYFKGVDMEYNQRLIHKVSAVTLDDVKRVGAQYVAPLFDAKRSKCAVCCHPSKVQEVAENFKGLSRDLKILDSIEDPFLCNM